MRKKLEDIKGRKRYCGTFVRYGTKSGWHQEETTVLLKDITDDDGEILCDHLWMNHTLGIQLLGDLEKGDKLSFVARVSSYRKGYGDSISYDYKLSRPTQFERV